MSALPFIPLLPGSMRSMSVTCSVPFHVPGKKSSTFQMRSLSNNTVFEDQSQGVICYRDENGEIVCEGYDEGPRFPRRFRRC
ncbi:hypothetical protein E1A91_D06G176200v1 [Gossypium mustelinum]|uniref:Uncharacterized protein n=1 Tax=Gossypium mustelinum TaxID=34275 RepID=A0A5D2UJP0_GOSMU|nr:hypothetical protein E1A91_D06G176200v1 [Gossypium mustelinum]